MIQQKKADGPGRVAVSDGTVNKRENVRSSAGDRELKGEVLE